MGVFPILLNYFFPFSSFRHKEATDICESPVKTFSVDDKKANE